ATTRKHKPALILRSGAMRLERRGRPHASRHVAGATLLSMRAEGSLNSARPRESGDPDFLLPNKNGGPLCSPLFFRHSLLNLSPTGRGRRACLRAGRGVPMSYFFIPKRKTGLPRILLNPKVVHDMFSHA